MADSQPKRFFAYLNRRRRTLGGIPVLTSSTGSTASTDLDKAELFAEHYRSTYSVPSISPTPLSSPSPSSDLLADIPISTARVESLLRRIPTSKASGLDGLHPRILKILAPTISPWLPTYFVAR